MVSINKLIEFLFLEKHRYQFKKIWVLIHVAIQIILGFRHCHLTLKKADWLKFREVAVAGVSSLENLYLWSLHALNCCWLIFFN